MRRLAVISQRTLRPRGVGALENPVLPRGQTPVDFRVHRFGAGEAQAGFHPRQRIGRERRALLDGDAHLVGPIQIVGREGDKTRCFSRVGVEPAFVREHFVHSFRLGEEARLQAHQAVAHRQRARVEFACGQFNFFVGAVEHVSSISREREFEQVAGEATAGFDEREETLRGEIEPAQDARHVENDLAHEPMITMRRKRAINCEHVLDLACGAQADQADL